MASRFSAGLIARPTQLDGSKKIATISRGLKASAKMGGFSLVEVTMAIGLVSFCLVAMLGLLPVGLSQERKSSEQLRSLQAIGAVAADFQSATIGSAATALYGIKLPAVGGTTQQGSLSLDENFTDVAKGGAKYFEVMYKVEPPSSRFSNYRLSVRVARSSMVDVASKLDTAGVDYVESVILKPAL